VPAGLLVGLALVLTGCNEEPTFGATKGVTAQSHEEYSLWYGMAIAGIVVAVFVWLLIFWAVFRYRKKDDRLPRQFQEHIPLELAYTIIPLAMVLVIFGFTFVVENSIDRVTTKPSVIVNVTGYQWGWIFNYANTGGVTVQSAQNAAPSSLPKSYFSSRYPTLELPVGETTRFFLRSDDVIHGFYVHAFNFSRYAQPGITNEFEMKPTQTGRFQAQCTQYCGLYHSEMLFNVKIVPPAEFTAWLKQQEQQLKNPITPHHLKSSEGTT
jgi:cytochrome c oxidase subunit 2